MNLEAVELLGKSVTIRDEANVYGREIGRIRPYSVIAYTRIVPDSRRKDDPNYQWLELANGFCNYIHPPVKGPRFDLAPRYGWLKHDDQLFGKSRPELNNAPMRVFGLPETIPNANVSGKWVSLVFEIQWFMFWILKQCGSTLTDGELKKCFASYLHSSKAMTNHGNGSDRLADFVNGKNLDNGPMRMQPMTFGGGFHRLIGKAYRRWGKLSQNVLTIDPNWLVDEIRKIANSDTRRMPVEEKLIEAAKVFADIFNHKTNPSMFFAPTNSTRKVLDGNRRQVDPFPMHDPRLDRDYFPYLPFMSYGGRDAIDARRVVEQDSPIPPNPFWPPR